MTEHLCSVRKRKLNTCVQSIEVVKVCALTGRLSRMSWSCAHRARRPRQGEAALAESLRGFFTLPSIRWCRMTPPPSAKKAAENPIPYSTHTFRCFSAKSALNTVLPGLKPTLKAPILFFWNNPPKRPVEKHTIQHTTKRCGELVSKDLQTTFQRFTEIVFFRKFESTEVL